MTTTAIMFTSVFFAHSFLIQNWVFYVVGLGAYLALFLVLPRITPRKELFQLKEGGLAFAKKLNAIVVAGALTLAYFVGVGIAWLFTRLTNKKLMTLHTKSAETFWVALPETKDVSEYENMY